MKQVDTRYGIGELAELAGVSRRTVHFYVQQGLLEPPIGRGRGSHYTAAHLEQLRRVLLLQRQGMPLRRIQDMSIDERSQVLDAQPEHRLVLRLAVARGVTLELDAAAGRPMPSAAQLAELGKSCAGILQSHETGAGGNDDETD